MAARHQAVERVILTMQQRLEEPLSLRDLADVAILSAFHFSRVFRQSTGVPPAQFLYALRLDAAKRLLLTSKRSVIDVCYEVGYNSLGTFTTRFTKLVGVSPRRLRRLARDLRFDVASWVAPCAQVAKAVGVGPGVSGRIEVPDGIVGPIFIGLFPGPVPQGHPVACTIAAAAGPYRIAPVAPGRYYVCAAQFGGSSDPLAYLLSEHVLRGAAGAVDVREGAADARADIALRPRRLTDPPILVTLPSLVNGRPGLARIGTARVSVPQAEQQGTAKWARSKRTSRARVSLVAGGAGGRDGAEPRREKQQCYRPLQQVGLDARRERPRGVLNVTRERDKK